jgi:hypothetical protein
VRLLTARSVVRAHPGATDDLLFASVVVVVMERASFLPLAAVAVAAAAGEVDSF